MVDPTLIWSILVGARTHAVRGDVSIGRGAECEIVLDDRTASRRHARLFLEGDLLVIEDLLSRHGVRVNGQPVQRLALTHGDRITIGAQVLMVRDRRRAGRDQLDTVQSAAPGARPVTEPPPDAELKGELDRAALTVAELEDAFTRDDVADVARCVSVLRDLVGRLEQRGGTETPVLRRFSGCTLRAAARYARAGWVDAIVETHAIRRAPMHAATIDALEGALDRLPSYDRAPLRAYVASLDDAAAGSYERLCVERLRTLVDGAERAERGG